MNIVHRAYVENTVKNPKIREMMEMLIIRKSPIEVPLPLFEHKLITRDDEGLRERELLIKKN